MNDYWVNKYKISNPDALKYLKANGTVVDENGNVLSEATDYWQKVYREAEPKAAKYLHADGTIDENSGSGGGSYDDTELRNRITQAEDNIGTLASLKTSVKTDLVSAINEIVPDVPSRPVLKFVTGKSTPSNTSELTAQDLQAAGVNSIVGSYLVTVYRDTSQSQSYFIGWIYADTTSIATCDFSKLAGAGESLRWVNNTLQYSGGDASELTTWIFDPIGDNHTDD